MATTNFRNFQRTNLSFEEVFSGEYDLQLVKPPATVLDIGANEGAFTAWALEKWPACIVESFEPVPTNAAIFAANHGANPRVKFYPWAVSNAETLRLRLGLHNSGECSAFNLGEQTNETVNADCIPPSGLNSSEFVKIDTEGCELEILRGLDLSKTKAVVLEYHREEDRTPICLLMAQNGFEVAGHKTRCHARGIYKFARPGALLPAAAQTSAAAAIPDDMRLSGNTADGITISLEAGHLRNEHYRPSLRGKKLFIGLPVYSQMATSFVNCLLALQARKPLPMEIHQGSGDGVARTRNILTSQFLKSDCTHLLFIDCDLIFSAEHIVKLLEANQPVIGGFYPKKQQGRLEWVINTLDPHPPVRPDGLQQVRYIGTGFICIERSVVERMIKAHPESKFREDYANREIAHEIWPMTLYGPGSAFGRLSRARELLKSHDFTANGSDQFVSRMETVLNGESDMESRYLSEDWYFCQRWLDLGGEIFGHTHVLLRHIGPVIFPLDSQVPEIARPQPPSTTPASDSAPMAESAIPAARRDLSLTIPTN